MTSQDYDDAVKAIQIITSLRTTSASKLREISKIVIDMEKKEWNDSHQ